MHIFHHKGLPQLCFSEHLSTTKLFLELIKTVVFCIWLEFQDDVVKVLSKLEIWFFKIYFQSISFKLELVRILFLKNISLLFFSTVLLSSVCDVNKLVSVNITLCDNQSKPPKNHKFSCIFQNWVVTSCQKNRY